MKLHPAWIRILSIPVAATIICCTSTAVWAQEEAAASSDKAGWALGYALTVLAIVLGLTVVCRPGNRAKEVRIQE